MYFAIHNPTQRRSIHYYGKDATALKAAEECNELAAAITKRLGQDWTHSTEEERAAATENMVEEIADVLISIVNVMEIFSFDKNEINRQINKKQDRLRKRMGLEDNAND